MVVPFPALSTSVDRTIAARAPGVTSLAHTGDSCVPAGAPGFAGCLEEVGCGGTGEAEGGGGAGLVVVDAGLAGAGARVPIRGGVKTC